PAEGGAGGEDEADDHEHDRQCGPQSGREDLRSERLNRDAAADEGQRRTDPGQESALIGQGESGIRVVSVGEDPTGDPAAGVLGGIMIAHTSRIVADNGLPMWRSNGSIEYDDCLKTIPAAAMLFRELRRRGRRSDSQEP